MATHNVQLQSALNIIGDCVMHPDSDLPTLIGDLARLTALAQSQLLKPAVPIVSQPNRLIGVKEAAPLLDTTVDSLYKKAKKYPFTRRVDGRVLFSFNGLQAFIKRGR